MKRLFGTLFVLCFLLSISIPLFAQVTETPNLGLNIISPGSVNWGPLVNENFTILDTKVVTLNLNCADGQVPTWAAGKFSICGSGAGHAIYDEATLMPSQPNLRFLGAGVAVTNNPGATALDVTITGAAFSVAGVGVIRQTSPGVFDTVNPAASPCSAGSAPRGLNADLTPFGCTAYQVLDPDLTIYAAITPSANTQTMLPLDFAGWRTSLSLVPGTNVQTQSARLTELAALSPTANKILMSDATNFVYGTVPSTACDPLRWDPTSRTFSCATYPGGAVSGTLNRMAKFNSATTVGDSTFASESGTGITITGQTCLSGGTGCATAGWSPVTTGFTSIISRTMKEVAGTEAVTTGTISSGNCLQGDASGRIITTGTPCASTPTIPVSKSVTLLDPTAADTNKIQFYFAATTTLVRIACSTDTGTATINFDERAEATPNTAGTNTLASNLVCDNNSQTTTTFSDTTIAANVPYNLQIISVSGTPTVVRVHVTGTN